MARRATGRLRCVPMLCIRYHRFVFFINCKYLFWTWCCAQEILMRDGLCEISGGERTKSTVIFTLRTPYLRYGLKKNMSDVVVVNIFVTIKITCQHDVTHNLQPYSELVRSSTKLGPIAKRICCNQSIGQITCNKILHGLHSKLVFTFVGLMYVSFGT